MKVSMNMLDRMISWISPRAGAQRMFARMSMAAAVASLSDSGYFADCTKKIQLVRQYTATNLNELGFEVLPSMSNFLLARHPAKGGEELYLALKERGILVRHFGDERIKDYIRVSIGTREQMDAFLGAVRAVIAEDV